MKQVGGDYISHRLLSQTAPSPSILYREVLFISPRKMQGKTANASVLEIEEEEEELEEVPPRRLANHVADDEVYVPVGKSRSSMDALAWALKHVAKPSSVVYLIHVFPEVHHIPTPIGQVPRSQLSSQHVEAYMIKERAKRREMLHKFINLCQASKVKVDTLLIESDLITKAIVDLIPVLNIKRLITGATKSNLRKLMGSSRAERIQKAAPHYCEVKIICEGQEITTAPAADIQENLPPYPSNTSDGKHGVNVNRHISEESVSCNCFSRKF